MCQEKKLFTESFKIRSSEIRPDGKAKLQTICDLLQEIAGNHALQLNFDVTQLQEQNLTWVLHRLDIQIERYPEWRERVTVHTWPSAGDKLRAHRDFRILDEDENELVRALSYWLMIDTTNRRPTRMPQEVLEMAPSDIEHTVPIKSSRPNSPEGIQSQKTFPVRRSDLDVNRHVNNIKYVEWITETLPAEVLVQSIDIEFKAECEYGETVLVRTGNADNGRIQSDVMITDSEKVLATADMKFVES